MDEEQQVGMDEEQQVSEAAKALSKLGASEGGKARARALNASQRRDIAKKAAQTRWSKTNETGGSVMEESPDKYIDGSEAIATVEEEGEDVDVGGVLGELPVAKHRGYLNLLDLEIP